MQYHKAILTNYFCGEQGWSADITNLMYITTKWVSCNEMVITMASWVSSYKFHCLFQGLASPDKHNAN